MTTNKTIAVYAGSFDPFHVGHFDILQKAEAIFGEGNVILAMGANPGKQSSSFSERLVHLHATGRPVMLYDGFLHDFLNSLEESHATEVVLVRGLRNGEDLAYEANQIKFIRDFKPDLKVTFFLCDPLHEHVSSSALRQLEKVREGSSKRYLV